MIPVADEKSAREIIRADEVIEPGGVTRVETPGELLRIKASVIIASASLLIGVSFLIAALALDDTVLKSWATGLISLIVGAAIGFVFSGNSRQ